MNDRLGFYRAILAGEPGAGSIYADYLADQGLAQLADHVRARDAKGKLKDDIWIDMVVCCDRLAKSQTAFQGWYNEPHGNGLHLALERGYVPTFSRSRKLPHRLGIYLETMGYEVFWIA